MNRKNANTVNEVLLSYSPLCQTRQRSLLKMTSGLIPFYQGQDIMLVYQMEALFVNLPTVFAIVYLTGDSNEL